MTMPSNTYTIDSPWLMHGDCLEGMKQIPDGSVDLVLTDPPYGTTACKWDSVIPLEPMWEQLHRVLKPDGAVVMTASQPFTAVLVSSNLKNFKESIVWVKNRVTGHLNAKTKLMRKHEDIVVFYRKQCTYNPQKTTGHLPLNSYTKKGRDGDTLGATSAQPKKGGSTERYPTSVLEFDTVAPDGSNEVRLHPTQKPLALIEYLMRTYSDEGDSVLSFTMGSGTVGVAAKSLGRKFIGIEKDEHFFHVASERIKNSGVSFL